jgi:hypothetical protein
LPISAIHKVLVNKEKKLEEKKAMDEEEDDWNTVGQATVSKFTETAANSGKFQLEFTNDASHLSDKENLRANE